MNKRLVFWIKVVVMAGVLGFVGWGVFKAWRDLVDKSQHAQISVDWRYGIIAAAGFCGVMLTSGLSWRWLAWKMGDRSPTLRMLGAYTFSQMGKYVPGKVALLLMRIDRAGRFGMTAGVCTLSTLLENALYMISGGLVGMFAIAHVAGGLPEKYAAFRPWLWPATAGGAVLLACACHPKVFYGLVGKLLRKMGKPEVPVGERLKAGTLVIGVLMFLPCWIFGGLALWASACCVRPIGLLESAWFGGAFSLSVIIGMGSFLPGGFGIREAVLGAAVGLELAPVVGHERAILMGAVAAVLQRIFQLVAEVILGIAGGVLTRGSREEAAVTTPTEI